MENGSTVDKALFYLGKINPEELQNNFDLIYDRYKARAEKKGLHGDIKFVESLETIFIYVMII